MRQQKMRPTENEPTREEEVLYEKQTIGVDRGQELMRVDKFLVNRVEGASRTKVQRALHTGMVLVNGEKVKPNYRVKPQDEITIWDDKEADTEEITPEDLPLEIMYEDEDILIINKAAGMVVHPACGHASGTLLNAVAFHFQKNNTLITQDELPRLGLVHRIDKDTSGVLVMGKNAESIKRLVRQFSEHTIQRRYVALVWGDMQAQRGRIDTRIGRHARYRKLFDTYPTDSEVGKTAVTHYEVCERFRYTTLVHCRLETGRTHQIRVHLKSIGHTLFSDIMYGGDKILKGTLHKPYEQFVRRCFAICPRQALHARELGFVHPRTGKNVFFEAPLPDDFAQVVDLWRNYVAKL